MSRILSKPGTTTGMVGALLALQIVIFRVFGSATLSSVSFAGQELSWGCAFRQQFGVPCPNCGMTRSVLLSLHGHVGEALALNPAGPLLVAGTLLFSAAMFCLMFYERRHHAAGAALARAQRGVKYGALAYAALLLVVWIGHWFGEIL